MTEEGRRERDGDGDGDGERERLRDGVWRREEHYHVTCAVQDAVSTIARLVILQHGIRSPVSVPLR
jgi:hypothetical protein